MKYLLGVINSSNLVFADIEIRNRNNKKEFSACFDEVELQLIDEEYLKEQAESYAYECGEEFTLSLLKEHDCTYSELADVIADNSEVSDLCDISLYPECFSINGDDYYFLSAGCGQHDTRKQFKEEGSIIINEQVFNKTHELWDKYHLKEIPEYEIKELKNVLKFYDNFNEHDWVKSWIKEVIK